jgi:Lrp/AsnC family transcriptional regulator, leucine-responsive regulatory protein
MTIKLDLRDRKILYELDINARQSNSKIAKKIKVNPNFIRYRIENLEKREIINGYYSMIDFSKLGYFMVRTYVKLKNLFPKKEDELIEFIKSKDNIFWFASIEGEWDIIIAILVKSHKEFKQFWDNFESNFKSNVDSYNQATLYEYIDYRKNYLIEKGDFLEPEISGTSQKINLDEKDLKLLSLIANNSRMPLLELGKELKLTSTAVIARIKNLERKKVILGYRPIIDLNKLNYQYYKLDFELEDIAIKKELTQFVKFHPNMIYEDRTIGGSDFECDIEVENHKKFLEIMESLENKYKEKIRKYKYYLAKKIHKISYVPAI